MKILPTISIKYILCIILFSIFYTLYGTRFSIVQNILKEQGNDLNKQENLKAPSDSFSFFINKLAEYFRVGFNESLKTKYRHPNKLTRRLPDALIIGVKKCGTRALLEFLRIHPDVRAAGSEVHFFDKFYHRGFEWYRQRMPPTLEGQLTMEKTPSYWVTRSAPRRVHDMNPDVRLLAVVRDPVTRAVSDYTQSASKRPSLAKFEDLAIANASGGGRADAGWPPLRLGVYARALRRWLRCFPRHRLLIVSGERLVADPAAEMATVQDFLGLKRLVTEKHFYFNSTKGFPCLLKSEGRATPHCLGKNKGRSHPRIEPRALDVLRDFYRPHNERFYRMSGVNFGWS